MGAYHRGLEYLKNGYVRHRYMTMAEEERELREGKKDRQRRREAGELIPFTPPRRGEEWCVPPWRPDETPGEKKRRLDAKRAKAKRDAETAAMMARVRRRDSGRWPGRG